MRSGSIRDQKKKKKKKKRNTTKTEQDSKKNQDDGVDGIEFHSLSKYMQSDQHLSDIMGGLSIYSRNSQIL